MTVRFLKDFGKHFPNDLMLFQTNNLEDLNLNDYFDFANFRFTTYHIDKIDCDEKYIFLHLEQSKIDEKKSISVSDLIQKIRKIKKVSNEELSSIDDFDNTEVILLISNNKQIKCAYNVFLPYTLAIPLYSTIFFTVLPYPKKCNKDFANLYSEYFIEKDKAEFDDLIKTTGRYLKENKDIGKPRKLLMRSPLVLSDD